MPQSLTHTHTRTHYKRENPSNIQNSKYYKGGFDGKMSKREAGLVLGVSPSASKIKIKDAHKRIMLSNHPDRGSPGVSVCVCLYMYVYLGVCVHVYVCKCVCMFMYVCIYLFIYVFVFSFFTFISI